MVCASRSRFRQRRLQNLTEIPPNRILLKSSSLL